MGTPSVDPPRPFPDVNRTGNEQDSEPNRSQSWIGRLPKLVKFSLFTLSLSVTIALPLSVVSLVYSTSQDPQGNPRPVVTKGPTGPMGDQGNTGATGAKGDRGAAGVRGHVITTASGLTSGSGGEFSLIVKCEGGRKIMGGGGFVIDSETGGFLTSATMLASFPVTNDSWLVWVRVPFRERSDTVRAYAVCAFTE